LLHAGFNSEVEIHVPRRYSLEVSTGGGNIDVRDIDGRIRLTSAGGNIATGRVGAVSGDKKDTRSKPVLPEAARIVTQGGEISVGDVQGTLRATTAGGHIVTGIIQGNAILRTAGGQIHARKISGAAVLDSGGGNVYIESAGPSVAADTAGGSLALRQAEASLDVSAKDSNVTAWLSDVPAAKFAAAKSGRAVAPSQVSSDGGDIVLYVPRSLAASIDAVIEQSSGRQIAADPSLSIKNSYLSSTDGDRTMRCVLQLNGGGKIIHLKAIAGNIVLRPLESVPGAGPDFPPDLASAWVRNRTANPAPANLRSVSSAVTEDFSGADGFFAEMRQILLEAWWGSIPVDAEEMQKHLQRSVAPVYPEVARQAGVEGDVVLRVSVSPAGSVADIKVLEGPPILARAAVQAVQQWRYQAPKMNGRPTSVTTTLVLSFRLHQN
jgi:protein TonB